MNLRNLTPASGCQDHTTSPYALAPFVRANRAPTLPRPPHPAPTSVTIAKRPYVWDGIISLYSCFYQNEKRNIFANGDGHVFARGSDLPVRQFFHRVHLDARRLSGARVA
jgi:hypothetical protein